MKSLTKPEVASIPSLLAKSAYMFLSTHVRDGVWEALFVEHCNEHYGDNPRKLKDAQTNFKRRSTPDKNWSWKTYLENLAIISRAYKSMEVKISLSRDGAFKTYTVKIDPHSKFWEVEPGTNIINTPKLKKSLFMPSNTCRDNEDAPTFIIRDTLRRDKVTIEFMDKRLRELLSDPTISHTYAKGSTGGKAALETTLKRGKIEWSNIPRLLKIFRYASITLEIKAELGMKEYNSIVGFSL